MNPPTTTRPTITQETPGRCRVDRGYTPPLPDLIDAYLAARRSGYTHTAAAFASLIRNHPERTRA